MNGANSRSGAGGQIWYEGGQTPLWKRSPKRGFNNKIFAYRLTGLNLNKLVKWIEDKRIDPSLPITLKTLYDTNIVQFKEGVKILGTVRVCLIRRCLQSAVSCDFAIHGPVANV